MTRPVDWIVVSALALPHMLYSFVWLNNRAWRKLFQKNSVHFFACIASLLKVVQFTALALWYNVNDHKLDPRLTAPSQLLVAVLLIGAGQLFNFSTFKAIGEPGLGHKVPWCTGFPFNVVRHPQYVGSVLSIWGGVILAFHQSPPGLVALATYWSLLYLITGAVEQFL
eukprot:jgi/Astpho2/1017/Aster-00840